MSDTKTASGRFLLRLDPGLHELLRKAAAEAGLSLNDWCARKLAAPGGELATWPAARQAVERGAAQFGADLLGVLVFGSWARGEAREASDVDLLFVIDDLVPLRRALYRRWDADEDLLWDGRAVQVHFAHLPAADRVPSALWAEVALDGIVLFARDLALPTALSRVRRAIAEGRLVRKIVHGQPYWVQAA